MIMTLAREDHYHAKAILSRISETAYLVYPERTASALSQLKASCSPKRSLPMDERRCADSLLFN